MYALVYMLQRERWGSIRTHCSINSQLLTRNHVALHTTVTRTCSVRGTCKHAAATAGLWPCPVPDCFRAYHVHALTHCVPQVPSSTHMLTQRRHGPHCRMHRCWRCLEPRSPQQPLHACILVSRHSRHAGSSPSSGQHAKHRASFAGLVRCSVCSCPRRGALCTL